MDTLRQIPSVDALLRSETGEVLSLHYGRTAVTEMARHLLDSVRGEARRGDAPDLSEASLLRRLARRMEEEMAPGLRPVINATGVVLHTNLGRAPLSVGALEAVARTGGRYLALEMDLETGRRGARAERLERHVCAVTGAEDALVVNNNAAAVLLLLATLARGREVVVSRGELVEIGGSFRIPEVMAASGALMLEVGTTNRTRPADFESACGENTALLLKVHPSNYRVVGFTQEVSLRQLAEIGRRRCVPVAMDLGSGTVETPDRYGMPGEPTIRATLEEGADVVTFSGDKALGGPQAGYLVGRAGMVRACRRNPLMRALRAGKLTLAAAEATWRAYRLGRQDDLPVLRMLGADPAELRRRASTWLRRLEETAPGLQAEAVEGEGRVGGGAAPGRALPTTLVRLRVPSLEAGEAAAILRRGDPPVLARVHEGLLFLDPRTVLPEEDEALLAAVAGLARGGS